MHSHSFCLACNYFNHVSLPEGRVCKKNMHRHAFPQFEIGVPQSIILRKVKNLTFDIVKENSHRKKYYSGFFCKPATKFSAFQGNQLGHLLSYYLHSVNASSMEFVEIQVSF